jgi:hypothetical protein
MVDFEPFHFLLVLRCFQLPFSYDLVMVKRCRYGVRRSFGNRMQVAFLEGGPGSILASLDLESIVPPRSEPDLSTAGGCPEVEKMSLEGNNSGCRPFAVTTKKHLQGR